jgi:carboxyl-terminal processing protease
MDEQDYQDMLSDTRGEIEGVGLDIDQVNGTPQVVAPIEGGPAILAGIKRGDRILEIDGQSLAGQPVDTLRRRLRGPAGSKLTLTIARGHEAPFTVALTRAVIEVASVTSSLEPDAIGYIRISQFTEMTPIELGDAIARLKQKSGGKLSGFVLDLRDDPGGLVDSAVAVASDFLDGGTVVTTHGRDSDDDDTYTAFEKGDLIRGTPMAVLINSYSASAAEIVAGALQDRQRATVLGTRSFGKGTVQTLLPLDGHGALRLTTALYLTPSGRSIQGSGITPDIVVPLPQAEREADAVVTHENDLPGALPGIAPGDAAPSPAAPSPAADEAPIDLAILGTAKDDQLVAALGLLQRRATVDAALLRR